MLKENTLLGESDKVADAIRVLRSFEPEDGYYVAFSGGKDSQCIYHLCEMAGVKFDAHYTVTSVDPPELVRFIKEFYPDVSRDIPHDNDGKPLTMWNVIPKYRYPPTRKTRYCCKELKESNGKGRVTVTGVRWAESSRRKNAHGVADVITKSERTKIDAIQRSATAALNKKSGIVLNDDNDENRRTVEQCYRTRKVLVNPIVSWSDEDVWEFLNEIAKVPHCCLYDEGFDRLGCIGCPMSTINNREKEFDRYPKFADAYKRAFTRMIQARDLAGKMTPDHLDWSTADKVFEWWMHTMNPKKEWNE